MLKFNADLFRLVATARSSELTRYYLNGVYVCPAASRQPGVYLIATDGHRLLWGYDAQGEAPTGGVILQTAGNKLPGTDFKASKGETSRRVEVDTRGGQMLARIVATYGDDKEAPVGTAFLYEVEATFPDTHRVVPKHLSTLQGPAPCFQGRYLADFGKVAADYTGTKTGPMHIRADDAASPALVTFGPPGIRGGDGIGLFGVLMPIRGKGAEGELPGWLSSASEAIAA